MREDHIRYEAIRRRAARTVRRRLWRSLVWHGGMYLAATVCLVTLYVVVGPPYFHLFEGPGPFVISLLWLPLVLLHGALFFGNWFLDMLREGETWREIERLYDRSRDRRTEERDLEREQTKVKRDFARLSDDGELEYIDDYDEDDLSAGEQHQRRDYS
jgi:hypothetical protein